MSDEVTLGESSHRGQEVQKELNSASVSSVPLNSSGCNVNKAVHKRGTARLQNIRSSAIDRGTTGEDESDASERNDDTPARPSPGGSPNLGRRLSESTGEIAIKLQRNTSQLFAIGSFAPVRRSVGLLPAHPGSDPVLDTINQLNAEDRTDRDLCCGMFASFRSALKGLWMLFSVAVVYSVTTTIRCEHGINHVIQHVKEKMASQSTHLPQSVLTSWNTKGKDDALELLRTTYKNSSRSSNAQELSQKLGTVVHDLAQLAVSGKVDVGEVCKVLNRLNSSESIAELPSILADTLCVVDIDVHCRGSRTEVAHLLALVQGLGEVVPEDLWRERLEADTLEALGLVPDARAFVQKGIKLKTRLFYKQQKFNLLREESEGYSKLITELSIDHTQPNSPEDVLEVIKSLIGRFSLDPNRVLDVILEALECHREHTSFYVQLLRTYPHEKETFLSMFASKFRFYQIQDGSSARGTPSSLYRAAAVLVKDGLISLQDIFQLLSPSLEVIRKEYGAIMKDARSRSTTVNRVSILPGEEGEGDKPKPEPAQFVVKSDNALSTNQKLGLCHALIECGDYGNAMAMVSLLPPSYPLLCSTVRLTLCRTLHATIDPLYRCYMPKAVRSSPLPPPPGGKQCLVFADLVSTSFDLLYLLGSQLHADPILLVKVLRIFRAFSKEYAALKSGSGQASKEMAEMNAVYRGVISALNEAVLPSLSLLPCNCSLAEDIWNVMRSLPYHARYHLYGLWKNEGYQKHPDLVFAKAASLNKAKYIMKRITKDNVKQCGRQIGKLSHSNPGIVFDYVLSQIQNFDSLIVPVVDSLKYLSPLSYDMLSYCVIEALANPAKERLKHEDTTVSQWLQGLATFCGTVYKKYPLELSGLLQFVANQLKGGKSFDLLILKEVVQKMSGIECLEELMPAQVEAMAGGEILKAEGASFVQIRNVKKSSSRLKEALIDSDLGLPLSLLIGQQRDSIVFGEGEGKHVKLLGMLYDYCMETLVQFQGFLEAHLSSEEYARKFPDAATLQSTYHLPHDIVFFFTRPRIQNSIQSAFDALCKASGDEKKKWGHKKDLYVEAVESVVTPLVAAVGALPPPRVWDDLSHRLYVTFWSLSLSEVYVPVTRYQEEVAKQKQIIHGVENNPELSSSKRKKEVERCSQLIQKLREECAVQEERGKLVMARLDTEKDAWFGSSYKNKTITQFLQLCIFPRCMFSISDAVFCAKFVQFLHISRTTNFPTLLFFDRMFADISYTTAMCTENEARRYGRFMSLLLEMISRWHQNKDIYDRECGDTPGFHQNVRGGSSDSTKCTLDFDSFRHICFKWHFKVTKALVTCLESKDYQQIRNALVLMTKLVPHYPKVLHLSAALEKRVQHLYTEEKDKRKDLHALALGYAGKLKANQGHLILETEFHNKDERVKATEQQRQGDHGGSSGGEPQGKDDRDRRAGAGGGFNPSQPAGRASTGRSKSPQLPRKKSPTPSRAADDGRNGGGRSSKEGRGSRRSSPKDEQATGGRSSKESSGSGSSRATVKVEPRVTVKVEPRVTVKVEPRVTVKVEPKAVKSNLSEFRSSRSKPGGGGKGDDDGDDASRERPSNHGGGGSRGGSLPENNDHLDQKGRDLIPTKRRTTPSPEIDSLDTKRRKVEDQKIKEEKIPVKRECLQDNNLPVETKRKKVSPSRDFEHKRRSSGKSFEEGVVKPAPSKKTASSSRDPEEKPTRILKSSKR